MNASRYALVGLTLGVFLLGLLPTGAPQPPLGRERAPTLAALAPAEADHAPPKGREERRATAQRWTALRQRLLQPTGASAETEAASCPPEDITVQADPPAREETDKPEEADSRLWEAELSLMRVLAAQGNRASDRPELPPSSSSLDELARLISWKGRGENRGPVTIVVRPTQDRSLGAASPAPTLRR